MKARCYRLDSFVRILSQLALVCLLLICTGPAESQTTMTKYAGNPVMQPGPAGSWDDGAVYPGPVMYRDSAYHLWYIGWDGTNEWSYYRTGYARSNDGIHWAKNPRPVIDVGSPGAWDALDAEVGGVLYDGIRFKTWYNGYSNSLYNQQIGYATGISETTWTKRPDPVLTAGPSGSWDKTAVMYPCVRSNGPGSFEMWYAGWNGSITGDGTMYTQIGYATASNETTWTKHALSPVLTVGSAGQWDNARIFLPVVIVDDLAGVYHMFYSGKNTGAGAFVHIGYARSRDGVKWTKHGENPVLAPGPNGSWDQNGVILGGVVMVRDTFRLWYAGYDASWTGRIGYATSPDLNPKGSVGSHEGPKTFMLEQNYPNPFNPTTVVGFQLQATSKAKIAVYDVLGREIAVLVNEQKAPGQYAVQWNAQGFPSGVYLCRMVAGDYTESRKMVLMK